MMRLWISLLILSSVLSLSSRAIATVCDEDPMSCGEFETPSNCRYFHAPADENFGSVVDLGTTFVATPIPDAGDSGDAESAQAAGDSASEASSESLDPIAAKFTGVNNDGKVCYTQPVGTITYYGVNGRGGDGLDGHRTSNGERVHRKVCTAAHLFAPFGSMVTVTNAKTKKSAKIRVNDCGPYVRGHTLDVTKACLPLVGATGTFKGSVTFCVPARTPASDIGHCKRTFNPAKFKKETPSGDIPPPPSVQ